MPQTGYRLPDTGYLFRGGVDMVGVGDKAPEFSGKTGDGTQFRLKDMHGRRHVVLYFFPKDFTPGCTKEACSFRNHRAEIAALDGEIVGVSFDTAEKHAQFAQQYELPFPLVSDSDGKIAGLYGVSRLGGWLPSKRVTFVIDKSGVVRNVIHSEFSMDRHVDDAIASLKQIQR
jgi:peroxiredoxin Q/BCP